LPPAIGLATSLKNRASVDVLLACTPKHAVDAASDLCESGPMLGKPHDPQFVHERIKKLLAARARRGVLS
jgi:hypothetical protein